MGGNARRQQQMAAKKKARRKKRQEARRAGGPSSWACPYSKSEVRRAPLHGCWASGDLWEKGIGHVIMARRMPHGELFAGVFLVDVHCLGVKNAFPSLVSERELDDLLRRAGGDGAALREVDPAHAVKLVEGARAYAKDLGFPAHEDYHDAAVVFGEVGPADCTDAFVFGKDGKPHYISGPFDSDVKIRRIIATLHARCGAGNYDYIASIGSDSLMDDGDVYDEDGEDDFGEEELPFDETDAADEDKRGG